jgi:hypothetical protein
VAELFVDVLAEVEAAAGGALVAVRQHVLAGSGAPRLQHAVQEALRAAQVLVAERAALLALQQREAEGAAGPPLGLLELVPVRLLALAQLHLVGVAQRVGACRHAIRVFAPLAVAVRDALRQVDGQLVQTLARARQVRPERITVARRRRVAELAVQARVGLPRVARGGRGGDDGRG